MRGGQYLSNARMVELHAQESPDRVRELEAWGALFRPDTRRRYPPAELRWTSIPTPCHTSATGQDWK